MKIRYGIALFLAKISVILLKITKHNGTNFPGELAIKICPDFLKQIKKPKEIYMITGTVGKTTVSNMLSDALTKLGKKTLNNSEGSNINSGIATTFIKGVTWLGKSKYDVAALELDERHSRTVCKYVVPDYLIITNIAQDSIMRHAHPEYIAAILSKYIPKETTLVLNGDNLQSLSISPQNKRVYFGIAKQSYDIDYNSDNLDNVNLCPKCNSYLKYEFMRGSAIGKAKCSDCGFTSPHLNYSVNSMDYDNNIMSIHCVDHETGLECDYDFSMINSGLYNIYNQISVISLLLDANYEAERIEAVMKDLSITKSRFDYTEINGTRIWKMSAKGRGSYGCSRLFEYILSNREDKEIILLLNSEASMDGWGEDTCWLYDCAFEILKDDSIKRIVIAGESSADYLLRLKLAGIDSEKIIQADNAIDTPDELMYFPNDNIYSIVELDLQTLSENIFNKIIENVREGVKK